MRLCFCSPPLLARNFGGASMRIGRKWVCVHSAAAQRDARCLTAFSLSGCAFESNDASPNCLRCVLRVRVQRGVCPAPLASSKARALQLTEGGASLARNASISPRDMRPAHLEVPRLHISPVITSKHPSGGVSHDCRTIHMRPGVQGLLASPNLFHERTSGHLDIRTRAGIARHPAFAHSIFCSSTFKRRAVSTAMSAGNFRTLLKR